MGFAACERSEVRAREPQPRAEVERKVRRWRWDMRLRLRLVVGRSWEVRGMGGDEVV